MYQPILKGKKAEFDAWQNVRASKRKHAVPLFELVVKDGTDADLASFRDRLLSSTHGGDTVAVDVRSLGSDAVESSSGLRPYSWLVRETQSSGVKVRPVIYLDDEDVVAQDALTASQANNELIVLRIGGGNADPAPANEDDSLQHYCATIGVVPTAVHLLIDFGGIYGSDIGSLQRLANSYLTWISANGTWASVTLASGAFPSQITALAKSTANMVPRLDGALWNLTHPTSPVPDLKFGDYGIRHPELPEAGFGGPLPNLRYATTSDWIVWREAKHKKYPNGSFYTACAGVVGLPQYSGAGYSWADGVIAAKAACQPGPAPGAGTGAEWITYGMNRHLEFVIDRLTTLHVA
jgi:hypothetical protein